MNGGSHRSRAPRRRVDGVLLLDKPAGATSNAVLQYARRLFAAEKAGHTGTLDPAASGLLPVCFGEATKFAGYLLDAEKSYRATIRFGAATTTGDAEGDVVCERPVDFDRDALERALGRFRGPLRQVPPRHAALKFEGRAYYEYARKGIDIPRPARDVTVHALDLVAWDPPDAVVDVRCSKGTYVRVLAEDIGSALGSPAHLAALRRVATGGFSIGDAATLDALGAMTPAERDTCLLPASVLVAHLPRTELDAEAAGRFRHGGEVRVDARATGTCAVYAGERLLGIAEAREGTLRPRRLVAELPDRSADPD